MGIDVNMYAIGTVSDEQLSIANTFLQERDVRARLARDKWDSERITVDMDDTRYYGLFYERGPWPEIHLAIVAVKAALPECVVHYGGDTDEDSEEATPELIAALWEHWLSPSWNDYRTRAL